MFDVTFLTSRWTCIFGEGCPGVLDAEPAPELEQGCCSYGAHFTDKADRKRVARADEAARARRVAVPGPRPTSRAAPIHKNDDGEWVTRLRRRRLHLPQPARFRRRRRLRPAPGRAWRGASASSTGSPTVCWQLPLRLEHHVDDNDHVTYMLREWKRRDWGEGGAEFHWWCTEDPRPSSATEPGVRGPAGRDHRDWSARRRTSGSSSTSRPTGTEQSSPPSGAQEAALSNADRIDRCVRSQPDELEQAAPEEGMIFPEYVLDQLVAAIDAGKHVILTGPPGTGQDHARLPGGRGGPPGDVLHRLPAHHRHQSSGRPSRPSAACSRPPTA